MAVALLLTDDEKVRIRHHLGFMNVSEAATFSLGVPASMETQFIIEGALNNAPGASLGLIRSLLANCDGIHAQMYDNAEALVASEVGGIKLRPDEFEALWKRYDFFRNGLANALGIYPNPYDKRAPGGGGGTVNISVRG